MGRGRFSKHTLRFRGNLFKTQSKTIVKNIYTKLLISPIVKFVLCALDSTKKYNFSKNAFDVGALILWDNLNPDLNLAPSSSNIGNGLCDHSCVLVVFAESSNLKDGPKFPQYCIYKTFSILHIQNIFNIVCIYPRLLILFSHCNCIY